MNRAFYSSTISEFLASSEEEIIGKLSLNSSFSDEQTQKLAWLQEIKILKAVLEIYKGNGLFGGSLFGSGTHL